MARQLQNHIETNSIRGTQSGNFVKRHAPRGQQTAVNALRKAECRPKSDRGLGPQTEKKLIGYDNHFFRKSSKNSQSNLRSYFAFFSLF